MATKPDPDRDPTQVAEALANMRELGWLTLIATVSVTEIVALAKAYLSKSHPS